MRETIPQTDDRSHVPASIGTGTLGMVLFLASLSMLLGASLILFLLARQLVEHWPPPGSPPLPRTLWLSTLDVLLISGAVQAALWAVRAERQRRLRAALVAALVLAGVFLAIQTYNWWQLAQYELEVESRARLFTSMFYILTGLHGAHVFGGLILLAVVTARAFGGRYTSLYHPGVRYSAMYWHFLDVVWLIMFALLMWG